MAEFPKVRWSFTGRGQPVILVERPKVYQMTLKQALAMAAGLLRDVYTLQPVPLPVVYAEFPKVTEAYSVGEALRLARLLIGAIEGAVKASIERDLNERKA